TRSLPMPAVDLSPLWQLGVLGVPLTQYLRWADDVGLIATLAADDVVTREAIVDRTPLTARGADALLGVLCSFGIVQRLASGYRLNPIGREYLDRRGVFYIGPALYGMLRAPLPPQLVKGQPVRRYSRYTGTLRSWWRYLRLPNQFGRPE